MPLTSCQEKNEFTITWKNIDGTVLEVDQNVSKGSLPTYNKGTPTYGPIREEGATSGTSYYFSGWDSKLTEVKEDKTYTATYTTKPNYDVKWIDDKGNELYHLPYVVKDNKPIYNKEFPRKEHIGDVYYAFSGWKDIKTGEAQHVIASDTIYQAQYDETNATNDYDCDGLLDYLDPDYKSPHNNVSYEYEDDKGKFDFAIDYYDYFINQDSNAYSKDIAKFTAALNIDAFYTGHISFLNEKSDFDDKKYIYERLGCDNIEEFFIEEKNEPNDIGGAILAHHKVLAGSSKVHEINQDYNIFFLTIKALRKDNIPLWKCDLDIGSKDPSYTQMTGEHPLWTNKDYHKGLFISSNRVKDRIDQYLAKEEFQNLSNKILVITGHSRGATTANYIAKQYQGDTNYDKIFAYTFGSPDYYFGNDNIDVPYIFNFINDDDLVEHVPFSYFNGKRFGNDIRFSIKNKYAREYSRFTSHSYESLKNIEEFMLSDVKPVIPDRDSVYKLDESEERCKGYDNTFLLKSLAEKDYNDNLALLNKYGLSGSANSPYHLSYDGEKTVTGYNCPYALYVVAFKVAKMEKIDITELLDLLKLFDNYSAIYNGLINELGFDIDNPMPKVSYPHRMSAYYVMADVYTTEP